MEREACAQVGSERFADSPDVLKSEKHQQTVVRVLDLEIGGHDFITMAGPCSVETELQLMATAHHVRRVARTFFVAAHSSRAALLMHFKVTVLLA